MMAQFVTAAFNRRAVCPWEVWTADNRNMLAAFASEALFLACLPEIVKEQAKRQGYELEGDE